MNTRQKLPESKVREYWQLSQTIRGRLPSPMSTEEFIRRLAKLSSNIPTTQPISEDLYLMYEQSVGGAPARKSKKEQASVKDTAQILKMRN